MNEISEQYRSWVERKGFAGWAVAFFWIIASFVLFQIVGGVVSVLLIYFSAGGTLTATQVTTQMGEHLNLVFVGNTTGQILFLGLGTWMFSRLHTSRQNRANFLRYNVEPSTLNIIGLVVLLILTLQPAIWTLSWLNSLIPMPDSVSQLEQVQNDMLEHYLQGKHEILITLFHISLVPAICEETLFRGYILRVLEKDWGVWGGIIVTGVLFGIFHLRLGQVIPLASIGIVLAYVAWRSDSIFPAMMGHFVNNGGSVLMAYFFPQYVFAEMTPETLPPVWMIGSSLLISGYLIYLINRQAQSHKNKVNQYVQ